MAPPRRELYIYYRVAADRAEHVLAAVGEMQRFLRRTCPGLNARLLLGSIDAAGVQTWMETYSHAESGIDAVTEQLIEAQAASLLAPHIAGGRHVEVFFAND